MYAILHEGNAKKTADNELLKLLIKSLGFEEEKIDFFGMGTKSNFFKSSNDKYKVLLSEIQEDTITKILFITDADYESNDHVYGGFENTQNELNKIIEELDIKNISDIYVTRNPLTNDGYLESLVLSSIPEEQKNCIQNFLDCSEFSTKENHKAILNQIYKIAYPNAPFDFNHKNFDELKQKITKLFKKEE